MLGVMLAERDEGMSITHEQAQDYWKLACTLERSNDDLRAACIAAEERARMAEVKLEAIKTLDDIHYILPLSTRIQLEKILEG